MMLKYDQLIGGKTSQISPNIAHKRRIRKTLRTETKPCQKQMPTLCVPVNSFPDQLIAVDKILATANKVDEGKHE